MSNLIATSHPLALWVFVWLAVVTGCSQDQQAASIVASKNSSNIQRLANLYRSYQLRHGSQGPKDEEGFKDYIQHAMPAHRLEMMQIDPDNIEGLFISERDGQPFLVRYGVHGGMDWITAVVFEQQGRNAKKQVGFTDGSVAEVDDSRFRRLLDDAGQSIMDTKTP